MAEAEKENDNKERAETSFKDKTQSGNPLMGRELFTALLIDKKQSPDKQSQAAQHNSFYP